MTACKDCGLAFEQVDNNGRCDGCASAYAAPGQQAESEIERLKREQEAMNQKFNMLASAVQRGAQPPQQPAPQQVSQADAARQFYADPVAAADYIASQRTQQMAQQMMAVDHDTMVENAKRLAREGNEEVWEKYSGEIETRMAQVNAPMYHRNVNAWKNIANQIAGERWRELRASEREAADEGKPKAPAIRTSGPAAPSTRRAPAIQTNEIELSDEAKTIAKKLKLAKGEQTADQRMRIAIKNYENQGSENDPTAPSSWDQAFTFDSEIGRKSA